MSDLAREVAALRRLEAAAEGLRLFAEASFERCGCKEEGCEACGAAHDALDRWATACNAVYAARAAEAPAVPQMDPPRMAEFTRGPVIFDHHEIQAYANGYREGYVDGRRNADKVLPVEATPDPWHGRRPCRHYLGRLTTEAGCARGRPYPVRAERCAEWVCYEESDPGAPGDKEET